MQPIAACSIFIFSFLLVTTASARENVEVVGSSTVYPFARWVAQRFADVTQLAELLNYKFKMIYRKVRKGSETAGQFGFPVCPLTAKGDVFLRKKSRS